MRKQIAYGTLIRSESMIELLSELSNYELGNFLQIANIRYLTQGNIVKVNWNQFFSYMKPVTRWKMTKKLFNIQVLYEYKGVYWISPKVIQPRTNPNYTHFENQMIKLWEVVVEQQASIPATLHDISDDMLESPTYRYRQKRRRR